MKIAILGYGVEGESVYNYYHAKYPDAQFVAYDNKSQPKNPLPDGVEFVGGVKDFTGIEADLAVKTPAIAPWLVEVSGEVTTMTREFMKVCPAPIIGVTGTKGKGTTASLIVSILNAAGEKTWLVGNIGLGAFDVLPQIKPEDIVVYELSSFQLWDLDISPHVAVVLGIEPEHLDVHKDFDDYLGAKANIARHQKAGDRLIYHYNNEYAARIARQSIAELVPYPASDGAHIRGESFYVGDQEVCSIDALELPGIHNQENACAAISAVWPWIKNGEVIAHGLADFKGLPYRIQKINVVDGVTYYNDSYASAPPATIVALKSVPTPTVLIAGGVDRGLDYAAFGASIGEQSTIQKVLLIGEAREKIAAGLTEDKYELVNTLEAAVKRAHTIAKSGDAVLLSPGCASFDMFKDFNDRGLQFTTLVEQL